MSKTVLYISYDGMTDPLGQSQVIPYLAGLSKLGFEITVLSTEKKDNLLQHGEHIAALMKTYGLHWHCVSYTKSPPVLSTIWDIYKLRQKCKQLQKEHGFAIVHCRSYVTMQIGLWMQRRFSSKLVFDMRGFWIDERVDGGLWNLRNPLFYSIYRYYKRQEVKFIAQSDAIISLTHKAKEYIKSQFEYSAEITVIPCCVDLELFQPKPERIRKEKRAELALEHKFVLCYLGSVGTWYMLPEMLDFFKALQARCPNAHMLFLSKDVKTIEEGVIQKQIQPTAVTIVGVERAEVPKYLSTADMSIFFIKPAFSKMASSPVKQGELMAMNIPIIANSGVGDTDSTLQGSGAFLVHEFTAEAYEKVISEIMGNGSGQHDLRNSAKEIYGLKEGVISYQEVYNKLLNG